MTTDWDPLLALRCKTCDYALAGLTESRCPECGQPFNLRDPESYKIHTSGPGSDKTSCLYPLFLCALSLGIGIWSMSRASGFRQPGTAALLQLLQLCVVVPLLLSNYLQQYHQRSRFTRLLWLAALWAGPALSVVSWTTFAAVLARAFMGH